MKTINSRSVACCTEDRGGPVFWTVVPENGAEIKPGEPFRLRVTRGQGLLQAGHLVRCLAEDQQDKTETSNGNPD